MWARQPSRINLRQLILLVGLFSAAMMLIATLIGAYQVQRQQLMDSTLNANQAFAVKLATATSDMLLRAQQDLAYSADMLLQSHMDPKVMESEVARLRRQGLGFNSATFIDNRGVIQAISPSSYGLQGKLIDTAAPHSVLRQKVPLISPPFLTTRGNLAIALTHPLYSADKRYLGYLSGVVYLKTEGGLYRLIGEQYFLDDTYVYVVDSSRRLIYHPQPERIGTAVTGNPVIEAVLKGRTGQQRLINSKDIDMLAGYAYVPAADWGVVVQRPAASAIQGLHDLVLRVAWLTLGPALLLIILLWFLSRRIADPLRHLAHIVQTGYDQDTAQQISAVRCRYFEAERMQHALLMGLRMIHSQFGKLYSDAHTDPLTGLGNRRGLEAIQHAWESTGQSFAVLALDIDFFKQINDLYGHDVGDEVIRKIGVCMRAQARQDDALFRIGGEEYLVLLPGADLAMAAGMANRLRAHIASEPILENQPVTVSVGVAMASAQGGANRAIRAADQALYRAKQAGRNRVEVDETSSEDE